MDHLLLLLFFFLGGGLGSILMDLTAAIHINFSHKHPMIQVIKLFEMVEFKLAASSLKRSIEILLFIYLFLFVYLFTI